MPASTRRPELPPLYLPREIAKALGCSEWWVKEQARKRRIPFSWIGGSYRFTEEHLTEIIRLFEVPATHSAPPKADVVDLPRLPQTRTPTAPMQLTARPPRRALRNTHTDAA